MAEPLPSTGPAPLPPHRLRPLPALGGALPAAERIGPVAIAESMDAALASIAVRRGREAEVRTRASRAGLSLPGPGEVAVGAPWTAFWVGPEMWFIEAPHATHEDIVGHLKPLFGDAASITEQTGAWVRLEVSGPLQPLLERLCNLDLWRFGPGSATRTTIEHLGVYAIRRAPDQMTLLGPRSSADSLHHALVTAARSAF